jgi:hypothetical protein
VKLSSEPAKRSPGIDSRQTRLQYTRISITSNRKITACGCLEGALLDKLLSLEPRIAGENLLEPHAEFDEVPVARARCFVTTNPTCYEWTSVCIENTAVC